MIGHAGDLFDRFGLAMDCLWTGGPIGIAVSGGGDSVALLHLAQNWARKGSVEIKVATVDHGLRKESAFEADGVANVCASLGLSHQTLPWVGWNGRGNLQAEARMARRRLLADWAQSSGLEAVCLGHTMDDQAETVLMRLGRGSGVDGLSGMRPRMPGDGLNWLRPLLGIRRVELRKWLTENQITWIDDPSNEDSQFNRVKARHALVGLADLGITAPGLAATAERLQDARDALDHAAGALAAEATRWGACGEFYLSLAPFRAAPPETQRRLLRAALTRTAGADYGPRAGAEQKLLSAILSLRLGGGRSLHGCLVRPNGVDGVMIAREVAATRTEENPFWDGRFQIETTVPTDGCVISALGEAGARYLTGLESQGAWTAPPYWSAAPRAARLATPALFRGEALVAAPVAQYGDALRAEFAPSHDWWVEKPAATV